MIRTGHIDKMPGGIDFETQRKVMEGMIKQQIPAVCLDRIKTLNLEMAILTAVKWMITAFTQEFELLDVVKIWKFLLKDSKVSAFHKRLAKLCGKVFVLLQGKIVAPDANKDSIMQMLNELKLQKCDDVSLVDVLIRDHGSHV
jgi:hypothetical protein